MKLLKTFVFASLIGVYGFAMAGDKVANPLLPKVEVKQDPKFEVSRPLSDKRYRELTTLKSRPMRSPMTRQIINVAVEDPESKDTDADLCPHYNGKIMVYTPIVLDPWSGLACYREHLGKPLDDETKQWVEKTLTPRLNRALSGIVGSKYSVSDNMVQDFFNHQENLPDTMRCSHALAYYTQIKAASSVRARLAWLTAWAYRRGINSPISGPYLMDSIRAVLKNISSDKSTEVDLQRRINRLAEMYKDESKYTPQERQIIGITLAGYYDRLGVPGWARSCLKAVIDECRKSYPDTDSDPWLKDMSGNVQDRVKEAGEQRKSLALEAAFRMKQIEYEIKYLTLSANLIRESLQTNQYPADKIPFFVYLVGEFERRAENFGAAKIWLDAASTMLTEAKEGDYAIDQIEVLKGYYSRLDPKPALEYEGYPADYKLLTEQIKRSRNFIKNGEDVRANVGTGTEKNTVRKPLPK